MALRVELAALDMQSLRMAAHQATAVAKEDLHQFNTRYMSGGYCPGPLGAFERLQQSP